jgi:hypothetical protein
MSVVVYEIVSSSCGHSTDPLIIESLHPLSLFLVRCLRQQSFCSVAQLILIDHVPHWPCLDLYAQAVAVTFSFSTSVSCHNTTLRKFRSFGNTELELEPPKYIFTFINIYSSRNQPVPVLSISVQSRSLMRLYGLHIVSVAISLISPSYVYHWPQTSIQGELHSKAWQILVEALPRE